MKGLIIEYEKADAEDLHDLLRHLQPALSCRVFEDGEIALRYIKRQQEKIDIFFIDRKLPQMDGFTLVRKLRERGDNTPVLFLTARDSVTDRVTGLDLGGDDYLVKPFDFEELLARLRAMTRKHAGNRSNVFTLADLTVDTRRQRVERGGREIVLLPKEFAILEHLIRNKGAVISREQLEDRIWNYEYSGSSNNVDVYMSRLRKKLDEGFPVKLIHTVRGAGWVLREDKA